MNGHVWMHLRRASIDVVVISMTSTLHAIEYNA